MSAGLKPTAAELAAARKLIAMAQEFQRRKDANPLPYIEWLPGQMAFLTCTASIAMFRAGGQHSGKTWAGAAELIWRMLGNHPFKAVPPAPIRAWTVAGTGDQLGIVQRKVWDLLPKNMLAPGCEFDAQQGKFSGRVPRLRLINGSECVFKSGGSDLLNLASDTLDYVWNDEPPDSEDAFNEFLARLLKSRGDLRITMTPVGRPVGWLRKRVEEGAKIPEDSPAIRNRIVDLHFPLTAANMIPVKKEEPIRLKNGTPCDQKWVDELIARYSPEQVPVRVHGAWEYSTDKAAFRDHWNPTTMVRRKPLTGEAIRLFLGIDHGTGMGKQCVYLIQVQEVSNVKHGEGFHVHVLDEYTDPTGKNLPRQDARAIKAMLDRNGGKNGLPWHVLDEVWGDITHRSGGAEQKSNLDLAVQLGKVYGVPWHQLSPPVLTVKRGEGAGDEGHAQWPGVRWMKNQMAMERFTVSPRCVRLIEAIPAFTGADDIHKDPIDAIRYGCKSLIYEHVRSNSVILDMSR